MEVSNNTNFKQVGNKGPGLGHHIAPRMETLRRVNFRGRVQGKGERKGVFSQGTG